MGIGQSLLCDGEGQLMIDLGIELMVREVGGVTDLHQVQQADGQSCRYQQHQGQLLPFSAEMVAF